MRRRNFLLGAITLPAWLSCAYSTKGELVADDEEISFGSSLGRAYLNAQSIGKPLLIFVVPPLPYDPKEKLSTEAEAKQEAAYNARYERGHAFGELLNHGTPEQLWPLALCEVICALPKEIELLTGRDIGAPLMALLETNTAKPSVQPIDGELPELFAMYVATEGSEEPSEDKLIEARIALLAKLMKGAIAPHSKALTARVNQLRAALPEESKALETKLHDQSLTTEQADRIAALIAQESPKDKSLLAILNKIVSERLCKPQIEGSRWAHSSGCGTTYENPQPKKKKKITNEDGSTSLEEADFESLTIVGCGMGHTPEKSQRFLSFYAEDSDV